MFFYSTQLFSKNQMVYLQLEIGTILFHYFQELNQ